MGAWAATVLGAAASYSALTLEHFLCFMRVPCSSAVSHYIALTGKSVRSSSNQGRSHIAYVAHVESVLCSLLIMFQLDMFLHCGPVLSQQ